MRDVFGARRPKDAQTLVFFILAFGTIILLCGLAIDSGLLYLAKARMSRAVDGAALAAVGNFHQSNIPATNRDDVALIMRNFAVANFTALNTVASTITTPGGAQQGTSNTYVYNFNDTTGDNFNGQTQDANGQYKRFVQVTLTTGAGGGITSATCVARCPVHTYFIGFAGNYFRDLKVSSSAVATRNPRLIMVVLDRSGSMLQPGGGAFGLPQAVTQFLDFFDTSSDYIGIVSFGSSARVEMALTTNFIIGGTNVLFDAYQIDAAEGGSAVPGVDPEQDSADSDYEPYYSTNGIRRMKFGGTTAADEGIRLGMEQLMANSGFNDPDVVKYLVLFTDGKWNVARTLLAAPGYTNEIDGPPAISATVAYVTNAEAAGMTNGQSTGGPGPQGGGPWDVNVANDTNLLPVPTLSPLPYVTNAIAQAPSPANFATLEPNHLNDTWQSIDGAGNEPLSGSTAAVAGHTMLVTTNTFMGSTSGVNYYTHNVDVWLQPGAVAYLYHSGSISNNGTYVSNFNNPTQHINLYLQTGDKVDLVVPGYVADGLFYDGLDLEYPDNLAYGLTPSYPKYRSDNFQLPWMWYDDTEPTSSSPFVSTSLERQLLFRNYANLLTGFYVTRADEPVQTGSLAPDRFTGVAKPYYGLGPYYPAAGFYWPFDLDGFDTDPTYMLIDPNNDPDTSGGGAARHESYSINMLQTDSLTNASPEWYGEWFYTGTGGTNVISSPGNTSVSTLIGSASTWQSSEPTWMAAFNSDMTSDAVHNSNLAVQVWRPSTFVGTQIAGLSSVTPSGSSTGGYVTDGNGNYYANSMAWSGRPTHYFDFSTGQWIRVGDNHTKNIQALPLCYWKAQEYAWHARAMGVTIYTVGYGSLVSDAQQVVLAQIANATNTTGYGGSNIVFNAAQPIGQQFQATTTNEISNDFYQVGTAINAALTQ